jgi:DNA helicase MCM8
LIGKQSGKVLKKKISSVNYLFRLQEVSSEASRAPGRIPQTIECELTNDLVNSAIPGDVVVVSGVVKLMVDENSKYRKG